MDTGPNWQLAASISAAVVVGAFVFWGPKGKTQLDIKIEKNSINFQLKFFQDLQGYVKSVDN